MSNATATAPVGHPRNDGPTSTATLLAVEHLGGPYYRLQFDLELPSARAGQFVMVRGVDWGTEPFLPRPMSLLQATPHVELLVKSVGRGTGLLTEAAPGRRFLLHAPLGRPWKSPDPHRRPLLVAGGVGVAPLLFLASSLPNREPPPLLLFGGKSSNDLPLRREAQPWAEVVVATEDGSAGHHGLVTEALEKMLDELHSPVEIFTCGPHPMMSRVAAIARARSIPCQVSLEARMACGHGVCLGCAVPSSQGGYLYACVDGPCLDSRRVRWEES